MEKKDKRKPSKEKVLEQVCMKIMIVDGQGGGVGRCLVEALLSSEV